MATATLHAVGRRKTSVARVRLVPGGSGQVTINDRPADVYFPLKQLMMQLDQPFAATETRGQFDVKVNVHGGGISGQAGAIRLGISRCLVKYDESMKSPLRQAGFMTRDPRMVERKKYGLAKARKRFQFSKR